MYIYAYMCVCVCVHDWITAIQQKLTQSCKPTILQFFKNLPVQTTLIPIKAGSPGVGLTIPPQGIPACNLSTEKIHRPEGENYVLLQDFLRTWASQTALRECFKKTQKTNKQNQVRIKTLDIKRLPLQKNQTSPVNEFSSFLCTGRRRSLGLLKSLLWLSLSSLGPASCFSPSWNPLGCTVWGGRRDWGLDGCNTLCWLWQVTFFIHSQIWEVMVQGGVF